MEKEMTQKSIKPIQKRNAKIQEEQKEENIGAWWLREDYVKRITNWLWRMRPFIVSKCGECQTCELVSRCHRIPTNSRITIKIIETGHCPDYKSVWKKILGDGKKYDWGF